MMSIVVTPANSDNLRANGGSPRRIDKRAETISAIDFLRQAQEVLEAAEQRADARRAEAATEIKALHAKAIERVKRIEEEAVRAGIEAVDQERQDYKGAAAKIINDAVADAKLLVANGEAQARETIERAKARAETIEARAQSLVDTTEGAADEARVEADEIRSTAQAEADEIIAHAGAEAYQIRARVKNSHEHIIDQARNEAKETLATARARADAIRREADDVLAGAHARSEGDLSQG